MTDHIHSDLAKLIAAGDKYDPPNRQLTGGEPVAPLGVHPLGCPVQSDSGPLLHAFTRSDIAALVHLLRRVRTFQRTRFPTQTLGGKLKHLIKEAGELHDHPGDPHEWADVLLLYLGAADLHGHSLAGLIRFAHDKLDINERREWLPADADGVFHHKE